MRHGCCWRSTVSAHPWDEAYGEVPRSEKSGPHSENDPARRASAHLLHFLGVVATHKRELGECYPPVSDDFWPIMTLRPDGREFLLRLTAPQERSRQPSNLAAANQGDAGYRLRSAAPFLSA